MIYSNKPDRELADLISAWHDNDLLPEQQDRLVSRLEDEPASRRAFLQAAEFEAMMHLELPDSVAHFPTPVRAWYRAPSAWLAAAACLALAASLLVNTGKPGTPGPQIVDSGIQPLESLIVDSTPVARITALNNVIIKGAAQPPALNTLLAPGPLVLEAGSIELTFFSGARVNFRAPGELFLKSDFEATLYRGKLTAQVPTQAIGFTVRTPTGQLRDLGTSFAMSVDDSGQTDIHVLDGKVEARAIGTTTWVTLKKSQATRIADGALTPIQFRAGGWPARPKTQRNRPLPASVHWTLDGFTGGQTLDAAGIHPLWMDSDGSKALRSDRLISGVKGQALSFNGKDQSAFSTYRGISGNGPRAVSFWVSIPPDAPHRYPNGIVSWGSTKESSKWQVCWNNGDQGTIGAPRVEFGNGYIIGTTDLRDGTWHHVAVVYLGGSDSDVASHVKLYVDGRLETLSGRRGQFIRTDTG